MDGVGSCAVERGLICKIDTSMFKSLREEE